MSVLPPEVHERVVEIFCDVFELELGAECEDVTPEDVDEWDSMAQLRLVSELEEVFELELGDDEAVELGSLRAVEAALSRRGVKEVPTLG